MSRERWFRQDDEVSAYDWARPARTLDVPVDVARALYLRATRRVADPEHVEILYLRWLRDAATAARRATAPLAVPGRQTRVTYEADGGDRARRLRALDRPAPGKWTRVLLETGGDQARLPAIDEVRLAMQSLMSSSVAAPEPESPAGAGSPPPEAVFPRDALREQLLEAAASGRGAAEALAAADPMTAATVLRELRSEQAPGQTAPVLQLVARAADGAALRVLGRGSAGEALSADLAARLGPHVGPRAVAAARLHTDDAADLVAAAHHARALTLGQDIYFARGAYAPGTERGDELLAHELTHVAQGQRGELARAAAKGVDSGGPLDPAEAEADMRARLAVIQLHPPEAAVPALVAPSVQPASDGDRAAMLLAQQQRISLADQPTVPLADPPAPPAVSPQAPVPNPAPVMTAPPAPAATGNAYVDTLQAPPSQQAMTLWVQAGTLATTQAAADQARFDASLPPMPAVLPGSEAAAGAAGGGAASPAAQQPAAGTAPPAAGALPPDASTGPAGQPTANPPAQPIVTPPVAAPPAAAPPATPGTDGTQAQAQAQAQAQGQQAIDALSTTAPDVKTDPGAAPMTDLAGQTDPVRTLGDHQQAVTDSAKALDDAKTQIVTGPGAARVQPGKLDEKLTVPAEQATGAMPALPAVDGMARFRQWNLPGSAQAAFDAQAKPKMDGSVAQAKLQMTQAETTRDADRTKAVSDAQDKVKQAHLDADTQQQTKVAEIRTRIANQQADTLQKHEAEVQKLDQQAGAQKTSTISKINDRVTADQAKVDSDFKDAQKRADDRKQQGEADAAKKKQDAQNQSNNQNWWDQFVGGITAAIQSIANDINQILTDIGTAIGQIIDDVKTAACAVIDAARDFVCQALTDFGDWLKSQVDALIGSVFPGLAAELDGLIDQAVSDAKAAVNTVANGLKTGVQALCDGLKASIDGVIAAFKTAVQAAATFAQAALTGDWGAVAKMVIDGILAALGIDPTAFYALVGQAQASLEQIVADPGAFVGHLIDAVKLGFHQFGDNFWTHLQAGLSQWLFGTLGSAGIRMPATLDLAGIFDLVCQVLGLTPERLHAKVVTLIGEENTKRLEFVAGYLRALVTGGFAGLWEKVQQDLGNLWNMVVGGIRDWLIQNVVQQAVIKLATMWNPVGAIFELIETAWNAYQFLRQNAQRIFGLVEAVVNSISNIVAGDISGAANFIEASLGRLVPIAISLFADLLGLGGIADQIKTIITQVQATVDQAIDALIERVKALFQGKGDPETTPDQEGQPAVEQFDMDGESHTLTITRTEEGISIVMASTPGEMLGKVQTALKLCDAELKDLREKKQGKQGETAQQLGYQIERAKNIKAQLKTLYSNYSQETNAALSEREPMELVLEIAGKLVEIGRKFNIRGFGSEEMDLRSMQALGVEGHQHDHFIYEVLAELAADIVNPGATPPDDALIAAFEAKLATARSQYDGAIRSSDHRFSFYERSFVVAVNAGNYLFPATDRNLAKMASEDGMNELVKQYGYQRYSWSVDELRNIAGNLAKDQPIGDDDLAMFLAAMVAEAHRELVTEVINRLVLGSEKDGTKPAFAANGGVLPMTTGGTVSDPPDTSLNDVRKGSAKASGPVTDQEIEMAKQYYNQATGADLVAYLDENGEDTTKEHVKSILRGQF